MYSALPLKTQLYIAQILVDNCNALLFRNAPFSMSVVIPNQNEATVISTYNMCVGSDPGMACPCVTIYNLCVMYINFVLICILSLSKTYYNLTKQLCQYTKTL